MTATTNPDGTGALFYIRLDTMDNIGNVAGSGSGWVGGRTKLDAYLVRD